MLLHMMSPQRLVNSVKTLPRNWEPVARISVVLYKRYSYLTTAGRRNSNTEENAPPRVQVLVLGGSVTMGVLCGTHNPVRKMRARNNCAWPKRLQMLLDSLSANITGIQSLFEVTAVALGGTNTATGTLLWKYGPYGDDVSYPDILINSFSTNDMHINSMRAYGEHPEAAILNITEQFVRSVLNERDDCRKPPLLIYLDDYLGNEQNEVLDTLHVAKAMGVIGSYYGISTVSYADSVRDIVYSDTTEFWFSSEWYLDRANPSSYNRGVHPGMGMHICMPWVIAFNFLNLFAPHCSFQEHAAAIDLSAMHDNSWNAGYRAVNGMPQLRMVKPLIGRAKALPAGMPPAITAGYSWLDSSAHQ